MMNGPRKYIVCYANYKERENGKEKTMDSLYDEVVVKPKQSKYVYVIVWGIFAFLAAFFALACYTAYVYSSPVVVTQCLPFVIAIFAITYYFFRQNKIEFEYIYCDDVLDIARIKAKEKRKNILHVETDNIEYFGPVTAKESEPFSQLPKQNYTSAKPSRTVYMMVTVIKGRKYQVWLEPSDKIISCFKIKLGRKIVLEEGK